MISRTAGLPLAWTGGSGTVTLEMLAGAFQASCTFPATPANATVPASVLGRLPAGTATFFFGGKATTVAQVAGWNVIVNAADSKLAQATLAP
jgi:hypothetical protein